MQANDKIFVGTTHIDEMNRNLRGNYENNPVPACTKFSNIYFGLEAMSAFLEIA